MAKHYRSKFLVTLTALALVLVVQLTPALAACTTHTIFTSDGRLVLCRQCCSGSQCTTTCF